MHKSSIVAALAGAALVFSGCGVSASQTNDAGHGTNVATSAAATHSAASKKDSSASDDQNEGVAHFGKAYVYEDGLSLTVSAPRSYRPTEYAAGTDGFKTFVSFKVRLVNKTGKPWDPSLFNATVQSGNKEGSQVFDNGLQDAPQTKLLNGREAEFTMAFGVANPKDIVMEVNPDMLEHASVMYQS